MDAALVEATKTVLLVGNPNVGKTSIFNALSSSRERVGNYPGVTVERRSATIDVDVPESTPRSSVRMAVIDVPGSYSLAARSREEQIAIASVLGTQGLPRPDAVIAIVDAGQLARCLYLVLQVLELGVPVIVALNMVDEAGNEAPSAERLEKLIGVPVVATNGRTGEGVEELERRTAQLVTQYEKPIPKLVARYEDSLRAEADRIADRLPGEWRGSVERDRALAFWALSSLDDDDELADIPTELREITRRVHEAGRDIDLELAQARYRALDQLIDQLEVPRSETRVKMTERLDRFLLHPVFGFVAFVATMFVVFQALFTWANPFIALIEQGVAGSQRVAEMFLPDGVLQSLIVDGVLGGVGNVVVFLPQILLLFLFIGLLEDSGYMARVAYLMDRVMRSLGLHGRAFVPMLSGFACAIPAIMATRTLERHRDRLLTMMVVPLMTCSARLPVYTLIIGALFPVGSFAGVPVQGLLLLGLYLFSVTIALVAAWVIGRTAVRGTSVPLILELPPYRLPRIRPTVMMMRQKSGQFLKEAGTVILAATIVLWALLSFPKLDEAPAIAASAPQGQSSQQTPANEVLKEETPKGSAPSKTAAVEGSDSKLTPEQAQLHHSYGARLGRALEPVVEPLGFDWKIATGIIGAFAAREVFVSTMALVYGIGSAEEDDGPLREQIRQEKRASGEPVYTPLVGLSLLVFFALACQCVSTLAVVRRETQSWRWPSFLFEIGRAHV